MKRELSDAIYPQRDLRGSDEDSGPPLGKISDVKAYRSDL